MRIDGFAYKDTLAERGPRKLLAEAIMAGFTRVNDSLEMSMKRPASHPLPDSSDEACAVCARDEQCSSCFEELVNRFQTPLLHFLLQRAANRQDAEDVLQNTFLAGYRNIGKYDPSWRFSTWIFTIAHRQAVSAARKSQPTTSGASMFECELTAQDQGPHNAAVESETRVLLWTSARDILESDAFTAVWLTYVEGMSADEVGRTIDRNANAVRILLTRARTKLGEQLPQKWRTERKLS